MSQNAAVSDADAEVTEVVHGLKSALEGLDRLPSHETAGHVAVYEEIHKALSDALSAVDDA